MRLFFLIPLTISLAAGHVFRNSVGEMAELAGLVIFVSLILSLVLAPWQFQLLVLMLVTISTKFLLLQNKYKMIDEEEEYDGSNKRSDEVKR